MDWVLIALASMALLAAATVVDKYIMVTLVPSLGHFFLLSGLLRASPGVITLLVVPWDDSAPLRAIAAGVASGLLSGLALAFMFASMRTIEVSRATPVFYSFPAWVAILATLFLNEQLKSLHWIAIFVIIAGVSLIAWEPKGSIVKKGTRTAYILLVLASLTYSVGQLTSKIALNDMDIWSVFALRVLGVGIILFVSSLRPHVLKDVWHTLKNPRFLVLMIIWEGGCVALGFFLLLLALSSAPVSLVSAVNGTLPLFVLLFSTLMSTRYWQVLHERLNRQTLAMKFGATAMVVSGVVILSGM